MGSLTFRRFTDSSSLREIAAHHLHALVRPYADFLARHGCVLPDDPERLNYEALGVAVLQPHRDTPADLIDALWHIHEMSTPSAMESLVEEARSAGLELDPAHHFSPADVATQVWLRSPEMLRRTHAETAVLRRKSFESFASGPGAARAYRAPAGEVLANLEAQIAAWYVEKRRGVGARVFAFEHEHEVRLVVRHGGPYRREGRLDAGEPGSVHFRPMAFGVAILDRRSWELRINGGGKRERNLYRRAVGAHLFGHVDFFPAGVGRYTLDPIREGRRCLVCADIPGLRQVRLTELRMYRGGMCRHARTEQADDVFLALECAREEIPRDALLAAAKFQIVFADSPKPRSVTIRHGNVAQYTRDEDAAIVESFLRSRGFVMGGGDAALACA
jgi:hypothetical protein